MSKYKLRIAEHEEQLEEASERGEYPYSEYHLTQHELNVIRNTWSDDDLATIILERRAGIEGWDMSDCETDLVEEEEESSPVTTKENVCSNH